MSVDRSLLDPTTRALLELAETQGVVPLYQRPLDEARDGLVEIQSSTTTAPAADVSERLIPGPSGPLRLHLIRPQGAIGDLPVVMYFHGGGWVLGDLRTHDRLVREIAARVGALVVFPEHSLSPEVRYPVANEEAYAATSWVAAHGHEIGADAARLAVAGDSAGGTMATVVAMLAKERGGPSIALQVLLYAPTDAGSTTASIDQFAEGFSLTRAAMHWYWDQYFPDPSQRDEPTASPLRATLDQLRDLPPALVITAECDVLRDQGEAYAHKLMAAGVPVTATRYLGAIHDFILLNILAGTPAARAALAQVGDALRQALNA